MKGRSGRAPSGQALAVPATPLRVDGPTGFDPSRKVVRDLLARFPRPPALSGGTRCSDFLLFMAEHEQKKGATYRAKEVLAIRNWLLEVKRWFDLERTGA